MSSVPERDPHLEPKVIRLADRKSLAGSRDFGIQVHSKIESALEEGRLVIVDCEGLQDMTPSFADETFGKLSEQLREDVTVRRIRIANGEQFAALISAVVRIRLQRALAQPATNKKAG